MKPSLTATAQAIAPDPVEAVRAGMAEPPFWAVIHPSGAVTLIHGKPAYSDLTRAVAGYLEAVPHNVAGEHLTGYCNEHGKTDGLAVNIPATAFFRVVGDILCGPVVVIGGPDREGEDTPMEASTRMRLVAEIIDG